MGQYDSNPVIVFQIHYLLKLKLRLNPTKTNRMEELKLKIKEYELLFDSLIDRALNSNIDEDSVEWNELDVLKFEIKDLAFSL